MTQRVTPLLVGLLGCFLAGCANRRAVLQAVPVPVCLERLLGTLNSVAGCRLAFGQSLAAVSEILGTAITQRAIASTGAQVVLASRYTSSEIFFSPRGDADSRSAGTPTDLIFSRLNVIDTSSSAKASLTLFKTWRKLLPATSSNCNKLVTGAPGSYGGVVVTTYNSDSGGHFVLQQSFGVSSKYAFLGYTNLIVTRDALLDYRQFSDPCSLTLADSARVATFAP